jgi:hypothetical protein
VTWPTCAGEPCSGIRVEGFNRCLAHLTPDELNLFLGRLNRGSDLDARGTIISVELLAKLMDAVKVFGHLNFEKAEFENVDDVGPLVARRLTLDGARFARHAQIGVRVDLLTCVGTRFEDGVTLRVATGVIIAERTVFGAASSIVSSGVGGPQMKRDAAWEQKLREAGMGGPALVSLRGTDVGNLVVGDIDLSWCLFAGAHRLDQIRFDGDCWWNSPPLKVPGTRRTMLAEEIIQFDFYQHPFITDEPFIVLERVTGLYRSLRKALEDGKNEVEAGDFYYGEMQTRRIYHGTPWRDRMILRAYWLLSGYGQRAGRAVAALGVLVAMVIGLLFAVGLPGEVAWTWARVDQSLRIGMGAVVFREAGQTLTSAGSWTVMVARFAGPVLLALAVLAIRARVKR